MAVAATRRLPVHRRGAPPGDGAAVLRQAMGGAAGWRGAPRPGGRGQRHRAVPAAGRIRQRSGLHREDRSRSVEPAPRINASLTHRDLQGYPSVRLNLRSCAGSTVAAEPGVVTSRPLAVGTLSIVPSPLATPYAAVVDVVCSTNA